jgi:hypothetical protein
MSKLTRNKVSLDLYDVKHLKELIALLYEFIEKNDSSLNLDKALGDRERHILQRGTKAMKSLDRVLCSRASAPVIYIHSQK